MRNTLERNLMTVWMCPRVHSKYSAPCSPPMAPLLQLSLWLSMSARLLGSSPLPLPPHHRLCSLSLCFPTPRCPPLPSFCRYKSAINWAGLHSLHFIRVKASPAAVPRCFVSAEKRNYATIPRLWSWNVARTASMQPLCDINMIIDLIWMNEFENMTKNISRQCFVISIIYRKYFTLSPSLHPPPFLFLQTTGNNGWQEWHRKKYYLYSAQSNYSSPPDTLL